VALKTALLQNAKKFKIIITSLYGTGLLLDILEMGSNPSFKSGKGELNASFVSFIIAYCRWYALVSMCDNKRNKNSAE